MVHNFPWLISLKVNIIAQLEFELTHYDVAVQYVRHYAMGDSAILDWNAWYVHFVQTIIIIKLE